MWIIDPDGTEIINSDHVVEAYVRSDKEGVRVTLSYNRMKQTYDEGFLTDRFDIKCDSLYDARQMMLDVINGLKVKQNVLRLKHAEPKKETRKYDCSKTEDYVREYKRMCNTLKAEQEDCWDVCPFGDDEICYNVDYLTPKSVRMLQEWSNTHPEEGEGE